MKVEGLLSLAEPEPGTRVVGSPYFYLGNVLSVIAFLGTLGGLKGLHALQAPSHGKIGSASFVAALVGVGLMLVTHVIGIASAGRPISVAEGIFRIALLVTLVGFVLYGAATLQAKVIPCWGGVALIIA